MAVVAGFEKPSGSFWLRSGPLASSTSVSVADAMVPVEDGLGATEAVADNVAEFDDRVEDFKDGLELFSGRRDVGRDGCASLAKGTSRVLVVS